MKSALLAVAMACLSTSIVKAQDSNHPDRPVIVKRGFYSGSDYRNAPASARQVYVMGLIDGMFYSPMLGAPKKSVMPLEQCASTMQSPQLMAIADQYTARHPETWDLDMNGTFVLAMGEVCSQRGIDFKKR